MSDKINIRELATALSEEMQITKKVAENFLRELFNLISEELMTGEIVKIKDLGTFKITEVSARESVNVRTGQRVMIPAHRKVSYVPDKKLSEIINEPYGHLETTELDNIIPEGKTEIDTVISEDIENTETIISEDTHESESTESVEIINEDNIQKIEEIEETSKEDKDKISDVQPESIGEELPLTHTIPPTESKPLKRRNPMWITFICLLLLAMVIYGIYFFITEVNNNEYNNTLQEFATNRHTTTETPQPAVLPEDTTVLQPLPDEVVKADTLPSSNIPKQEEKPKAPPVVSQKKITMKDGERLTLISLREYGNKVFWVYLYEANKETIQDPNHVLPGTVIIIPDAKQYNINKNDTQSIKKATALAAEILKNP